jgi:VIT1/CCC1 family predicted Fe2+/Mn2+ transporter
MLKRMTTEPMLNREKALRYFFILGAVNTIALPIIPFFFGSSYLEGVLQYAMFYVVALFVIIALWVVGIKLLKLDSKGPIPWYASPLVWFTPIFLGVMYSMFTL